jgi:hypothetical protein
MIYKFAKVEGNCIKRYEFPSYESSLQWINDQIETFKKVNGVKDESKDKTFNMYKNDMMEALENQHKKVNKGQAMDDYLKCNKCYESDHEGKFCRCEDRNIRIAKEQRNKNESPWQPERLNPEDITNNVCDSPTSEYK